jgi:hypothetical protein
VTGVLVNVQLEILVVEQKASSCLEDGHMVRLLLAQHIVVVPLGESRLRFHNLTLDFRSSDRVSVAPMSLQTTNYVILYEDKTWGMLRLPNLRVDEYYKVPYIHAFLAELASWEC